MKLQSIVLSAAITLSGTSMAQDSPKTIAPTPADVKPVEVESTEVKPAEVESVERVQLFSSSEQSSQSRSSTATQRRKMSAAKLRQARALYESAQRIRRIEANKWIGHEPLRPNWVSVPSMSSRYQSHRTIYVPVYIR